MPSLVRFGGSTQIIWSSENAESCSITEDNPTISDTGCLNGWCGLSGNKQSSGIDQRTRYTLSCVPLAGGALVHATTSVNVAPVFREK